MKDEEILLCNMLKKSLYKNLGSEKTDDSDSSFFHVGDEKLNRVVEIALKHSVLPFLFDIFEEAQYVSCFDIVQKKTMQTVQQNYHLLVLSAFITGLLKKNGVKSVILKGAAAACYYPVPEYRKSGDIDLLFMDLNEVKLACEILCTNGFNVKEEQHANHHIVCVSPDGIDIELHSMLSEPFDNTHVNEYLRGIQHEFIDNIEEKEIMGVVLPVLSMPYNAFYLLIHMLQHFLRSGFGLKLLCDWAVLLNSGMEKMDISVFLRMVNDSGIYGFADVVTSACVCYLGLDSSKAFNIIQSHKNEKYDVGDRKFKPKNNKTEEFVNEVFEAEEFGKSSADRMVVMRGTGIAAYVREFHHQMCLTYPKACKIIIIWPFLWLMMFFGFFYRNKKIRNVSGTAIIKKAAKRSSLVRDMKLFVTVQSSTKYEDF